MKNCKVCGDPLLKEGRTEHFACRQVNRFKKNGSNTAESRRRKAFNTMIEKPKLFKKLFV
jgi:hypothetical protein